MFSDQVLKKLLRLFPNIFSLFSKLFPHESLRPVCIFASLLITTALAHIFAWLIHRFLSVDLWVHSSTNIEMSMLLQPGLDGGYFEHFQYILLFWCFLLSLYTVVRDKLYSSLSIPLAYLFLFLDDSLSFHDYVVGPRINAMYVNHNFFNLPTSLNSLFAEVSFWLLVLLFLIVISAPIFYTRSLQSRRFFVANFFFFFFLAFFAVFVDALVANYFSIIQARTFIVFLGFFCLDLLEESGELITIAMACSWLFALAASNRRAQLTKRRGQYVD